MAGAILLPASAQAQRETIFEVSQPVVQRVPGAKGMRLNTALGRLARNPQDVEALIDAGQASLDLGDSQAAVGFFQRALALAPDNGRVKAGLAGAYVLNEDPFTAIPLFGEAALAGPIEPERLADRGLAYDLVGDNPTAQEFYRQSLALAPLDETLRRLAVSQAISGDRKGMDQTLSPLLQRQDKAGWRTRAFGFAILGNGDEAESIVRLSMPAAQAGSMIAYLRYMPKLTPAQQAAAANLGHFPRAAEIGRDDPRLAQFARPRVTLAVAETTPEPRGETSRRGKRTKQGEGGRGRDRPQPVPAAPPEPVVGREVEASPVQIALATPPLPPPPPPPPPPAPAPPPPPLPPPPAPAPPPPPPPPASPPPVAAEPAPVPVPELAAPAPPPAADPPVAASPPPAPDPAPGFATLEGGAAFDLRDTVQAQQPTEPVSPPAADPPPPPPAPPVPSPPPRRPSLEETFDDFTPPSRAVERQSGAVDIRKLRPASPKAKADPDKDPDKESKDAKAAPKPSHPSRIWVQVATGRDKRALGGDWGRLTRADAAVFKSRKGFLSAWGQTNRLLTGPFESEAAAKAFLAQLKKAGVDGAFLWTSPAGQVVDALLGGK